METENAVQQPQPEVQAQNEPMTSDPVRLMQMTVALLTEIRDEIKGMREENLSQYEERYDPEACAESMMVMMEAQAMVQQELQKRQDSRIVVPQVEIRPNIDNADRRPTKRPGR